MWSRIVGRSGNSSLWLLRFPEEAVDRLTKQAKKRQLEGDSLVLSSLLPIDSHLGIKSLAGILDATTLSLPEFDHMLRPYISFSQSCHSLSLSNQILGWTLSSSTVTRRQQTRCGPAYLSCRCLESRCVLVRGLPCHMPLAS